jgi:hypothetical protein
MLQSLFDQVTDLTAVDWLNFAGCLLALAFFGAVQYVAGMITGFGKKFQLIYGAEMVGLTALFFVKGTYVPFQIGLPLVLAFGAWKAYLHCGDEIQTVTRPTPPVLEGPPIEDPKAQIPELTDAFYDSHGGAIERPHRVRTNVLA